MKKARAVLSEIRLIDMSQVSIFGNVQILTQAMRESFFRQIPICFFSGGGWFQRIAKSLPAKNVELRRRQVLRSEDDNLAVSKEMVSGKILNARVLLRCHSRDDVGDVLDSIIDDSLGVFQFAKRTRRPPTEPVNCLLSYVCLLLVKDCT
ncbi:MAG: CRISPR-associated protein Cas1 [Ilumatobacter sp.]